MLIQIAQIGPIVQAGWKVAIPFRFRVPVVETARGARHQFVVFPPVAGQQVGRVKLRVSQTGVQAQTIPCPGCLPGQYGLVYTALGDSTG